MSPSFVEQEASQSPGLEICQQGFSPVSLYERPCGKFHQEIGQNNVADPDDLKKMFLERLR